MRRRPPYDWTGESVRRQQKVLRIAKLGAVAISIGILGIVGFMAIR